MKSIAEQFDELLLVRRPVLKKTDVSLIDLSKKREEKDNRSFESFANHLKADLALYEEVALYLRAKLGPTSAGDICKIFSEHVRITVRSIKDEIKVWGRPSFESDRALDRDVSVQLIQTLDRIKRAS